MRLNYQIMERHVLPCGTILEKRILYYKYASNNIAHKGMKFFVNGVEVGLWLIQGKKVSILYEKDVK